MANKMLSLISPKYLKYAEYKIENIDYCVYFVTDGYAIKVGMAASLPNRIKQLQTGNPREIKALYIIPADNQTMALAIEGSIHKELSSKQLLGEWFNIAEGDIVAICNKLGYDVGKPISKFDFGVKGIEIA